MEIEIRKEGADCTLKLIGEIHSDNVAIFDDAIEKIDNSITHLILDCAELTYSSSAGLRTILKAQKKMASHGVLKLINVNARVYEILEITGFSELLVIEKA
ncbi:MAG: STAS domain-containing protein [Bacilli bacterium]|nr:STAS domain-containing protein [Bacilli bacterium]